MPLVVITSSDNNGCLAQRAARIYLEPRIDTGNMEVMPAGQLPQFISFTIIRQTYAAHLQVGRANDSLLARQCYGGGAQNNDLIEKMSWEPAES